MTGLTGHNRLSIMLHLHFDKGTLLLKGQVGTPYGKWDPRVECYRIKAHHYRDVLDYLHQSKQQIRDDVAELPPLEQFQGSIKLRDYQAEAADKWHKAGNRGVLVLPTAAGKTFIALKAIQKLKVQTLIVVPTLDLIDQWRRRIKENLNVEAGVVGGGEKNLRMVTVATYDSACIHAEKLGNKFMLIIFDEVHHLASTGYMQIAEMYIAPYRMGLTATYERTDQRESLLPQLIGDLVYSVDIKDLAGEHLSPYTYEKIAVELTPPEQEAYNSQIEIFKKFLQERRISLRSAADFQKFIMTTGRDPKAREALLARNKAMKVALNSEAKLAVLAKQLEFYNNEKIIIFTLYNDLVYRISHRFLVPAITHHTPRKERREILSNFESGAYPVVVTSQVLDEGVDVPDASVGVILGGTGSNREYVQRLGRLLRKKDEKLARLIEIISKETMEVATSRRRHRKIGGNS
ncbi:MAG: DEAD/DEAH box helicase family protein [Candidatus Bathyarchaeota archaeon]|nr:DEAD/DEAH box helicase family protein [Candidatus Bathyarchaeota archaeon]MDD4325590.1 DEAD/DEAH box helicase family protein [Candidatus Bathyarchaeota archaeon]